MSKNIQSLERGLFIIETILYSGEPVSAMEISRRLGVHKSTVSHLTATLMKCGYLEREDGSTRLSAGPSLHRVSRALRMPAEMIAASQMGLEWLATETGETAHLAELRGRNVMFLENRYPQRPLRVQTVTGSFESAHSTAVGKVLLAALSEEEVRSMYSAAPERYTEKTITDVGKLLEVLERVRETGIGVDDEEQTAGTRCLAAPVRNRLGVVVAAVGISGPAERVRAEDAALREKLKSCALRIEEDMNQDVSRKDAKSRRKSKAQRKSRGEI